MPKDAGTEIHELHRTMVKMADSLKVISQGFYRLNKNIEETNENLKILIESLPPIDDDKAFPEIEREKT